METNNPYNGANKTDTISSAQLPETGNSFIGKLSARMLKNPFFRLVFNNWQYLFSFLIPYLILMTAYISFQVSPFGTRSVLALDLNAQYVYYYDYMYDVFAGHESIFYSWSRNLSGEFLGIIGYYLASPFNFIVWLFPRDCITEGLLTMMLVKVGCIGLTASVFFSRGRELSKSTSIIFSSLYALSSYVMVQTMNPMWLDGVMALPLVVYGIESLVRRGRMRLLILSLAYAFITSFYIGFMIGIFAAVYYFFYILMSDAYGRLSEKQLFGRFSLFSLSAIASVCLSAFIILPVLNSLSLGKFEFSEPDYTITENFTLFRLFGKLLPNSYDTVRMEGLPFLYCGVLTLLLVFCYFFAEKIEIRKRVTAAFFILTMTAFMYVRPIDMMWHGGQMPNWLPYRYSFMLSFLFLILAAETFEKISFIPKKRIGIGGLFFFLLTIFMGTLDTYNEELEREFLPEFPNLAIAALIIAIFTALLIQYKNNENAKKWWAFTVTAFIIAELSYNTITALHSQNKDIVYSNRHTYVETILPLREKVNEILQKDTGFYRMEKNFNRSANDPIAVRMYGATHSSSTLNAKPIELLRNFGFTSRSHYTKYLGATPMMDDLFGFKYILSCPGDDYTRITGAEDIRIEENTDAMPILYLTDPMLKDYRFDDYPEDVDNVFNKQNRFMTKILGDENINSYINVIPRSDLFLETENVIEGVADSHTVYTVIKEGENAQLQYTFNAPEEGEIFLWMPSNYEFQLNVWVNFDQWKGNYYETENYNAKSIGFFNKGEEITLTLTLTKDKVYFKDFMLGYFDNELYENDYARLRDMNKDTIVNKLSPTHLTALTNYPVERLLLTTIPAEPGWEVSVDGYKAESLVILDSLIGVMLPPGVHSVDLVYKVPYGVLAISITCFGICLFIAISIIGTRVRRRFGEIDYGKDEFFPKSSKNPEETIEDILDDLNIINEINDNDDIDEPFFSEETMTFVETETFEETVTSEETETSEETVTSEETETFEETETSEETVTSEETITSDEAKTSEETETSDEAETSEETETSEEPETPKELEISEEEPNNSTSENTAIPYKEVLKPEQKSNDFYAASAEDFFPQEEVDRLSNENAKRDSQ